MSCEHLAALLNFNECKLILNKFNQESNKNFQLKSFRIMPATAAKGFLGEYFNLSIQCTTESHAIELNTDEGNDVAITLKFFVKNLPAVNGANEKVKIFRKESSLYATLLPKLQKYSLQPWCPKIYLCYRNRLVLEDLDSQGFYALASTEILKDEEMFSILNGLATVHASSLLYEYETNENIGDLYSESLREITVDPHIAWFTTGLRAIIRIAKSLSKYQTVVSRKFIDTELLLHLKNIYYMVNPSTKYRNVLCHRDTWGGNIFLHRSDTLKPAIFVDFQTCRYSPPAIDVILTLFMNLTKQQRMDKQSIYIKFYYQHLIQHIREYIPHDMSSNEVIFSEAELLASVDEFLLFGFVYRTLAISILKVPKEFVTDSYKNVERSERLLQYMRENDEFCQIMNESIEDIIEAVAHK